MAKTIKQAIDRIREVSNNNSTSYVRRFSVEMTTTFARYTPVDTGLATGNWVLNPNRPFLSPLRVFDRSYTASTVRSNAEHSATRIDLSDDVYISNAVQGVNEDGSFNGEGYIIGLEEGKSQQAPNGMFLVNIARSRAISRLVKRRMFR